MEKPLDQLSASALRKLLIDEVKSFIECLETMSPDKLQEMRNRLRAIYEAISEKERAESRPLQWGKNSTEKKSENGSDHAVISPASSPDWADKT